MFLIIGKIDHDALVKIFDKNFKIIAEKKQKDGNLLKMAELLLKKLQKTPKDLLGIAAVNDSGTFSGLRSAVTLGNVLSFALKIPVTAASIKDIGNINKIKETFKKNHGYKIILPKYNKEPNITQSRPCA